MSIDIDRLEEVDPSSLDPPYDHPPYRSTELRAPRSALLRLPATLETGTGPVFGESAVAPTDHDLTRQHRGAPLGERIVVAGRILDSNGRAVAGQLVEIWQANASGRYAHGADDHDAALDPNFSGYGRCLTGPDGSYRFVTVRPGAYPWNNHRNAWRPAHIHFSVFGRAFRERLVTQMYFPGDPLLGLDPIVSSVADPSARNRLVASLDLDLGGAGFALGFRHDIVLGGQRATPLG
ncbi:MAG TPA: protocatechuate 3,4-dioxygenase subunit beta [Acidimicrobiales bacterium]|nr:protocatechuate 3,4-dioxygenase subunit beta [Acidimicrobiales bacterium]